MADFTHLEFVQASLTSRGTMPPPALRRERSPNEAFVKLTRTHVETINEIRTSMGPKHPIRRRGSSTTPLDGNARPHAPQLTAVALADVLTRVKPESIVFVKNLSMFFEHRAGIDHAYAEATTEHPGKLEAFSIADQVAGIQDGAEYKAVFLQQTVGGTPVRDFDDLYVAGRRLLCTARIVSLSQGNAGPPTPCTSRSCRAVQFRWCRCLHHLLTCKFMLLA